MLRAKYQKELEYCLAQAADLLGGPAQPLSLAWELLEPLQRRLTFELRRGLGQEPAMLYFDDSRRGHSLMVGIERYRWESPEGSLRIVKVVLPTTNWPLHGVWAVRASDCRRFYRRLRAEIRDKECLPPLLREEERRLLWDNTVGFLRRGREHLSRYNVLPKRGVLLLGEPGNGKTMACRWLAAECRRTSLDWKTVTSAMYEAARADREIPALFQLESPGIILFDDFDAALRDRRSWGESDQHATFLSELDGVEQKSGVIYLFTSNMSLGDLDPAMRRPGRIDVILEFAKPGAALRRRLIRERWHPDIVAGIDVERAVAESDGFNFAELEEARKLLVMHHLDAGRWDWPWVFSAIRRPQHARRRGCTIGFHHGPVSKSESLTQPAFSFSPFVKRS